jgi:HAD superfamily hydrolase (TIGR01549 family)
METKTAVRKHLISEAKGFIFDMDGTLLTLPVDWDAARERLMRISGEGEFSPTFEALGQIVRDRPELKGQLFAAIDFFELEAEPKARLYGGSRETLELLSRRAKLALVTMQGSQTRDRLLGRFAIAQRFQALESREDSLDRVEQLDLAVDKLGMQKRDVVFVADRVHDMNSAALAGVRFVMLRDRGRPEGVQGFPSMSAFLDFLKSEQS